MSDCPFALWTPVAATRIRPYHKKLQVILHTLVAGRAKDVIDGKGGWRTTVNKESNFIVQSDGTILQCMYSGQKAVANRDANSTGISIETEDHSHVVGRALVGPDKEWDPWTVPQMRSIMRLLEWCSKKHGIPLVRCPEPTGSGMGYHTMWGSPSPWTPVVKACPGPARIRQFDEVLMPFMKGEALPDKLDLGGYAGKSVISIPKNLRDPLYRDKVYYKAPPVTKKRPRGKTTSSRKIVARSPNNR